MHLQRVDYHEHSDTIEALDSLLFGPDAPKEGPDLGNEYWILWDEEGEAAGFCSVRPLRSTSYEPDWEKTAFLSRAGLLPHARGKGLQRRMLQIRQRWARDEGFTRITTYVALDNVPSARNLVKSGFTIYRPVGLWGGLDVIYFEKEL
jgi:GNAT superfamily N-acetyltransferase